MCGGRKPKQAKGAAEVSSNIPMPIISDEALLESSIPHITTQDELDEVLRKAEPDQLVVLDFYARWCGPCLRIAPVLESWVTDFPDVVFVKADVDKCTMDLPERFSIQSIPTFILFKNGQKVDEFLGSKHPVLRHLIDSHRKGVPPRPSLMDQLKAEAPPPPMTKDQAKGARKTSRASRRSSKASKKSKTKKNKQRTSGLSVSKEPTHMPIRFPTKRTSGAKKSK